MRIPPLPRLHWLASAAVLLVAPLVTGQPYDEAEPVSAEELIFLLQYVAIDYENAVRDAEIVNAFEYGEMRTFSQLLVDQFDVLRGSGASEKVRTILGELVDLIRRAAPADSVNNLASGSVAILLGELDLTLLPVDTPDLERGAKLYLQCCAACHGATGGGNGLASPGMEPPPTSFLESRMNFLSPHQIQGAVLFGIYETAHPSYREALTREEIWDISFFTMTLRGDFDPRRPDPDLPVTLGDLATRSNEELLESVRRDQPDAEIAHIDYYRRTPPPVVSPAGVLARIEPRDATGEPEGNVAEPWMGLSVLELATAARRLDDPLNPIGLLATGVYVDDVVFAGPASDAGVEIGDCVVSIEGEPILSVTHFRRSLSRLGIGKTVSVEIFRNEETFDLPVTIQPHPAFLFEQ